VEKLKPFPLKSGMRHGCLTLLTLIQYSTGIPNQSNKGIPIEKKEVKLFIFAKKKPKKIILKIARFDKHFQQCSKM
jgi:hypothetical protein